VQYAETDREAMIDIGGQKVSVHDFLVTAWTARRSSATRSYANATIPASISQAGGSAILLAMSQAAIELVDAGEVTPAQQDIQQMIKWFDEDLVRGIESAVATYR